MAEEEDIENEENNEDKGDQDKPLSQGDLEKKRKLKNFFNAIEVTIVLAISLAAILFIPGMVFQAKEENSKVRLKKIFDEDIFTLPTPLKPVILDVYKFPNVRQNEDKEFEIWLNDLSTVVKLSFYMAFDEGDSSLADELADRNIEIIDRVQLIIASKTYQDINTAEKREFNLKKELINEINSLLIEGKIKDLYFTEFYMNRIKRKN
ncbi:MAG TPA: flagellar basal body-associated FliL family protein [Spirochaetes bacterium]|mgnify:CR=1 FL=1|nr:flagellar basal body-associated FliL family protein [Spirochaetota bacterium]